MIDRVSMCVVGIVAAFKVKRRRPNELAFIVFHVLLQQHFRFGFQTYSRLSLIVLGTIEATHVEIYSHQVSTRLCVMKGGLVGE